MAPVTDMTLRRKRIGVLMGGPSAEREISRASGRGCAMALKRQGYEVIEIEVDEHVDERLRAERVEIAFVALHGPVGEDGTIQGLLELMRIPYTGSGVLASALGFFKPVFKQVLVSTGLPTPAFSLLRRHSRPPALTYPVVVKPAAQGSAIGISIVRRPDELDEALVLAGSYSVSGDPEILVETYIDGQEVTVGILDDQPLPVIEVRPKEGFYDYHAKYTKGATDYLCPAPLPSTTSEEVQHLALRAHRVIGCEGATRVDFRVDLRGRPFILEINTFPGMTETSLLPKAAAAAGIDYDTLVVRILQSALRRCAPGHPGGHHG